MLRLRLATLKRRPPPIPDAASRAALREAFRRAGVRTAVAVTLIWTDDREMRRLNRIHRGCDTTTDVLSFPLADGQPRRIDLKGLKVGRGADFTSAWPGASGEMGDIVISVPEALRESVREGRTIRDECLLLLVHGALHLLGYDHMRPADRKTMFPLQNRILRSLGAERTVLLP